ncbi:hypothetical protein KO498_12215 [Lentibacter algarum]|nr:hypothetical protein [Lentibacter algarum]
MATFEALLPELELEHIVRPELLEQARKLGVEAVRDNVTAELSQLMEKHDAVMCTCSTLGALVKAPVLRVDTPAMQAAAEAVTGQVLLAICLESTRSATLALFDRLAGNGRGKVLLCEAAWERFEAGDMQGYAAEIARTVEAESGFDAVVLAQASMAVAAPLLEAKGLRVFTTPSEAAKVLRAKA